VGTAALLGFFFVLLVVRLGLYYHHYLFWYEKYVPHFLVSSFSLAISLAYALPFCTTASSHNLRRKEPKYNYTVPISLPLSNMYPLSPRSPLPHPSPRPISHPSLAHQSNPLPRICSRSPYHKPTSPYSMHEHMQRYPKHTCRPHPKRTMHVSRNPRFATRPTRCGNLRMRYWLQWNRVDPRVRLCAKAGVRQHARACVMCG